MNSHKIFIEIKENSIVKIVKAINVLTEHNIEVKIVESPFETTILNNTKFNKKKLGSKGDDVLKLLAKGYTYNKISQEMNISLDGVRYYVKKIFTSLGVSNGRDAIRIYLTQYQSL